MKIAYTFIILLLSTGCTTLQDAKTSRGTGKFESFAYGYDKVWDAAVAVVEESKLDLVTQNKQQGEILAQKGMSALSAGENVAVFVDEVDAASTKVEVVSKKSVQTNVFAKDWSNYILENIARLLSGR